MEIQVIASGSQANCYRISDGETALLLDAGLPIRKINQALNFKTADLNGVLITHEHKDHCHAAKDLQKLGVPIYATPETLKGAGIEIGHRTHEIAPKNDFVVGTIKVLPFDTVHDTDSPTGFLALSKLTGERLLYFTDTKYMKYTFRNIQYILAECNYDEETIGESVKNRKIDKPYLKRTMQTHMGLGTLLDFLRACDLNQTDRIYLIHMSKNNADPEKCKRAVQELTGIETIIA